MGHSGCSKAEAGRKHRQVDRMEMLKNSLCGCLDTINCRDTCMARGLLKTSESHLEKWYPFFVSSFVTITLYKIGVSPRISEASYEIGVQG